ncbi:MAG: OOP family porin [uncultured Thiotrichaceae bacterium]|uniref:OOP family porin n=1 Tax=uncultured Thiotrichaceae bacterium TaxID=298394 RepID=A0A6S6UDB7_9GAMM|nr:MAG: OOP family porin [uncultured Thiotrichaceae bacterium]
MKNKKIPTISLVALLTVSFSSVALAGNDTYWTSSNGNALKDGSGQCVHGALGEGGLEACGAAPAPEPVKEVIAPPPIVKPTPVIKPVIKPVPKPKPKPIAPPPKPKPQTFVLNLNESKGANFGFDSAKLSAKSMGELDQLANRVRTSRVTPSSISVIGHTDSIGKTSYNQKLSVQRAQSVANYLSTKGMNRGIMRVNGMGETRPVASNKTKPGRAQNRRVEIRVTGSRTVTR